MKISKTASILFLIFILTFSGATAASSLRQVSNKEGLPSNSILTILQDDNGLMWLGTRKGLYFYNGLRTKAYKASNNNTNLSGNDIKKIIEAKNGIFWICTNHGLDRLDKKKRTINHFKSLATTSSLCISQDNHLFLLKENKSIYYYHEKSGVFRKINLTAFKDKNLTDLSIDSDNNLWLYTNNGAFRRYTIKESSKGMLSLRLCQTKTLPEKSRFSFHEKNAILYIDNAYGLFEQNLSSSSRYYIYNLKNELLKFGDVSSIIRHHKDYFIGFKTGGLIRLKNTDDVKEKYQVEYLRINAGINCLYNDRYQDIVWIGTKNQGIYQYFNDTYSIKTTRIDSLIYRIRNPISALLLDKEQTLWIGTKGDGIVKLHNYDYDGILSSKNVEHITPDNSFLQNNTVFAFANSKRNILWIGGNEGINYYSYKERKVRDISIQGDKDLIKQVRSIIEYNDSTLWIASTSNGLIKARIKESKNELYLSELKKFALNGKSMNAHCFFNMDKDAHLSIWMENRGSGLFKFDINTSKFKSINLSKGNDGQFMNDIYSVTSDYDGTLWCGTSFGLIKYEPNKDIRVFNEKNSFQSNPIHGILNDSQNDLWLSTNQGLIKFNKNQKTFQTFNQENGIKVTEDSDGACFGGKDSKTMFFGGNDGFVAIRENSHPQKPFLPTIYIDGLTIFGQDYDIFDFLSTKNNQTILKLNYKQNFFSISIAVNDYINGKNYSYLYKLDKKSKDWIDNGTSNILSFTNIESGRNTLLVKYRNEITGKESPVFYFIIKIQPAWYASIIAYCTYCLLLIMAITYGIRIVSLRNSKKSELLLEKLKQQHKEEVYESKLQFFTNIAHEFCTPLTLIYGSCNRILSYKEADSFVIKHTQQVQRNAERLNELIQELIEFRRIETGNRSLQIENLYVDKIIYNIVDSFNDLAESKKIDFSKNIQPSIEWNTDKGFLTVIVTNLISNAFKYVNDEGTVKINVNNNDGFLSIIVSNTGQGIKKEDLDRIFDPYTVLDNFENQESKTISARNGLGIAITNSLIKLLNGTIEIKSTPDKWTDFIVKIPNAEIDIQQEGMNNILPAINIKKEYPQILELPKYEFEESKQTILIINNEIEMLWFISEIFAADFNVISVEKSFEVEKILEETYPSIILCDIMMPDINGIELIKKIKANKKIAYIPIILISAKNEVEEKIEGLAAGAEMHITKPFNVDFLKASVNSLITRKNTLKDYYSSPLSAFDMINGQLTHNEDKNFIQKILNIINNNITNEDLSVNFIASEMNMSTRQLYRRLSSFNAKSPLEMIQDCRMYIARNLLINTKLTIDEIMYKSGFANRSSFYKLFAEKYSCTPKEYREINKKILS